MTVASLRQQMCYTASKRSRNGAVADCLSDDESPVLAWIFAVNKFELFLLRTILLDPASSRSHPIKNAFCCYNCRTPQFQKGAICPLGEYPIHLLGRLLARGLQKTPITEIARGGARTLQSITTSIDDVSANIAKSAEMRAHLRVLAWLRRRDAVDQKNRKLHFLNSPFCLS